jgi:hypothetical protein
MPPRSRARSRIPASPSPRPDAGSDRRRGPFYHAPQMQPALARLSSTSTLVLERAAYMRGSLPIRKAAVSTWRHPRVAEPVDEAGGPSGLSASSGERMVAGRRSPAEGAGPAAPSVSMMPARSLGSSAGLAVGAVGCQPRRAWCPRAGADDQRGDAVVDLVGDAPPLLPRRDDLLPRERVLVAGALLPRRITTQVTATTRTWTWLNGEATMGSRAFETRSSVSSHPAMPTNANGVAPDVSRRRV